MHLRRCFVTLAFAGALSAPASACIWDGDTLAEERRAKPTLAALILDRQPEPDLAPVRERADRLMAETKPDDPGWITDLAGAHIRLGELPDAVALLEPAAKRFPKHYAVHSNLGTAYHLQGRYVEAEREIARGLEIDPNAHFGRERYHLALLQYLTRDADYRRRHLYVDEWTHGFIERSSGWMPRPRPWRNHLPADVLKEVVAAQNSGHLISSTTSEDVRAALRDRWPHYRSRWDLGADPKFDEGVQYMASLNPQQAACWTMVGALCQANRDLNLAEAAFTRALKLGSPQAGLLRKRLDAVRMNRKLGQSNRMFELSVIGILILVSIALVVQRIRRRRSVVAMI